MEHLRLEMVFWATPLGSGSVSMRRKARVAKAEANQKFRDIGSKRRIGRLAHLERRGDYIVASFAMVCLIPSDVYGQ